MHSTKANGSTKVVFGGDTIKDNSGACAIFEEVGSTPTSMAVCRVLVAGHALNYSSIEFLQSDCKRAYIHAKLDAPPPRSWNFQKNGGRHTGRECVVPLVVSTRP